VPNVVSDVVQDIANQPTSVDKFSRHCMDSFRNWPLGALVDRGT
jgi:hypothetical protein